MIKILADRPATSYVYISIVAATVARCGSTALSILRAGAGAALRSQWCGRHSSKPWFWPCAHLTLGLLAFVPRGMSFTVGHIGSPLSLLTSLLGPRRRLCASHDRPTLSRHPRRGVSLIRARSEPAPRLITLPAFGGPLRDTRPSQSPARARRSAAHPSRVPLLFARSLTVATTARAFPAHNVATVT